MIKQFSMLALVGLIALPIAASAGMGPQTSDLDRKIQDLSSQLDQLKAQMAAQAEANAATTTVTGPDYSDRVADWDLAARFKLDGDFRARMDYYNANVSNGGGDLNNDTAFTNRFRLNMRVGVTENVEFKGRLAMYKSWGETNLIGSYFDEDSPAFDGNSTRTPGDNALRVDRAFLNFNNIGGAPVWFSIGRRPTTDGNPANLRMNLAERSGTPLTMDYAFDGISMGYAYNWGGDIGTGRVRVCYGRGFEDGLRAEDGTFFNPEGIDDTDFAGVSWDILHKDDRFIYAQSFIAANMPGFDQFGPTMDNNGNIYLTNAIYMDKIVGLNYFVAGGWSRTDPNANGLLGSTEDKDGYHAYAGIRYDIDPAGLKLGAEWNYGSKNWIGFTPGHDDLYSSKIAARGNVYEVYGIYELPMGEAISKYADTFMRLGYQRYEYNYDGTNGWLAEPNDVNDFVAIESADQVYLTLEATF